MARKQPTGGKAFDSLMRKLVQVPRSELEKAARKEQQGKKAKRRRKRKSQ